MSGHLLTPQAAENLGSTRRRPTVRIANTSAVSVSSKHRSFRQFCRPSVQGDPRETPSGFWTIPKREVHKGPGESLLSIDEDGSLLEMRSGRKFRPMR